MFNAIYIFYKLTYPSTNPHDVTVLTFGGLTLGSLGGKKYRYLAVATMAAITITNTNNKTPHPENKQNVNKNFICKITF